MSEEDRKVMPDSDMKDIAEQIKNLDADDFIHVSDDDVPVFDPDDTSSEDMFADLGLERPEKEAPVNEQQQARIVELEEQLAKANAENVKLKERNEHLEGLVASADKQRELLQDRFNVQSAREMDKFIKKVFLPTVDNLENALKYIEGDKDIEGITGVLTLCYNDLASVGVEKMEVVGQKFDPEFHNALTVGADPTKGNNTILDVQESGYMNTKTETLVRAPSVIVNKV